MLNQPGIIHILGMYLNSMEGHARTLLNRICSICVRKATRIPQFFAMKKSQTRNKADLWEMNRLLSDTMVIG